ncbi:MAG TPA: hypothetical protein DCZ05_05165 [Deltaproteobacteria bacterium]|nr:hypothetical protein [Deltaproteobacteria bacterium]
MRLGLLIRKGSIHLPEAISHDSKKPPITTVRRRVTHKLRFQKKPLAAETAAPPLEASTRTCPGLVSLAIGFLPKLPRY